MSRVLHRLTTSFFVMRINFLQLLILFFCTVFFFFDFFLLKKKVKQILKQISKLFSRKKGLEPSILILETNILPIKLFS